MSCFRLESRLQVSPDIKYSRFERTPSEIERAAESLRKRLNSMAEVADNEVHIDAELLDSITKTVTAACPNRRIEEPCTIYKVPDGIGRCDPNSYEPTVVCIGPYHYHLSASPPFSSMQDHKWRCVHKLASRKLLLHGCDEPDQTRALLEKCLAAIKTLESRVRNCYSEEILLESDELAVLMMLDGCFILHLLLRQGSDQNKCQDFEELYDSQVLGRLWIWKLVRYDLLLLENQIPFFIIHNLFNLLGIPDEAQVHLPTRMLQLFSSLHPHRTKYSRSSSSIPSHQVQHLLHLFYSSIVPEPPINKPSLAVEELQAPDWIPSATELKEAGVRFKKSKRASSLLDIKFSNGVLEIPPLEIHDYSYRLFKNLIAYEQCYPDTQCHVTVYSAFMDCMINIPKDMRVLHLTGILTNRTSAHQDAMQFFSRLGNQVHYASDKNYLGSVFRDLTKYHGSKRHRWRAGLVREYFSNPWSGISVGAAVLLLVLTITQTFCTVFSYLKHKQD